MATVGAERGDNREHPVEQEIEHILIWQVPDNSESHFYAIGNNCTRIEACTKSGMYANIPYVRVWKGDVAVAEFCQHQIVGVYFKAPT